jgi:hypothetical protein
MTQEIKDKARNMLASGYNMNQIASILMVDRVVLSTALIEKPKTKKIEDTPLFENEPGL